MSTTTPLPEIEEFRSEIVAATDAILTTEPEEIRLMRTGAMENQAGSFGQYFGTWDIAAGMLRDYSMYTFYPLVRLAEDENVELEQFRAMVDAVDPAYSDYLRYSGFPLIGTRAKTLRSLLATTDDRAEVVGLVRAFCAYLNRLAAWSFHYFPWGLGDQFRYEDDGEHPVPDGLGSTRVQIDSGERIRLTWEPIGVTVEAFLASAENPALCRDVTDALPFTIVQDHAVVTGESMYAWTPLISTAPVPLRERICDAPIGRLRFSQSTGQKLIVQYGDTTEDLAQVVLGEVIPEHRDRLKRVGEAVWRSTFQTKELIWLTVEKA